MNLFRPAHFKSSFPIYHKVLMKTAYEAMIMKEITAAILTFSLSNERTPYYTLLQVQN